MNSDHLVRENEALLQPQTSNGSNGLGSAQGNSHTRIKPEFKESLSQTSASEPEFCQSRLNEPSLEETPSSRLRARVPSIHSSFAPPLPSLSIPAQPGASLSGERSQGGNRVVTLAFLSEQLPASLLANDLARALSQETGSSVVLVRFEKSEEERNATELMTEGELRLPPQELKGEGSFSALTFGVACRAPKAGRIASLVNYLREHFRYVLIEGLVNEGRESWL